jgi:acylphosphatase
MDDMRKSISLLIRGHVHGVGFRYHAHTKAIELEIDGFVRNQVDGSVYIEVEGESGNLDEFVKWCRMGPRWSRVDSIDVQPIETRNYTLFTVK